jgi:hypothetical protein
MRIATRNDLDNEQARILTAAYNLACDRMIEAGAVF